MRSELTLIMRTGSKFTEMITFGRYKIWVSLSLCFAQPCSCEFVGSRNGRDNRWSQTTVFPAKNCNVREFAS